MKKKQELQREKTEKEKLEQNMSKDGPPSLGCPVRSSNYLSHCARNMIFDCCVGRGNWADFTGP